MALSVLGGANISELVRKMMVHLIENQFAKQINWTGINNKIKFSEMVNVNKLIIGKHIFTKY